MLRIRISLDIIFFYSYAFLSSASGSDQANSLIYMNNCTNRRVFSCLKPVF